MDDKYVVSLAGIPIKMNLLYGREYAFLTKYVTSEEAVTEVSFTETELESYRPAYPATADLRTIEFNQLVFKTSEALMPFERCIIHGVVIKWMDKAWLLTAPSGTGKTTQYASWKMNYGDEVTILNGDKAVYEFLPDGGVMVHHSPWRGKERLGRFISAPLGGIIYLEQGSTNTIVRIEPDDKFAALFMRQIYFQPARTEFMHRASEFTVRILRSVPVWRFTNKGNLASARVAHDALLEYLNEHR